MIIVTGGAGFIGSNLVAALDKRGTHNIVVCDTLDSQNKWKNLAKRNLADLIRPELLLDYLDQFKNQIEGIFHLGAISSTTETNLDLLLQNNFRLSMDLVRWCGKNRVRFIYVSSSSTYGDGSQGFSDEMSKEALGKLLPLNPYGWSKHLFDRSLVQNTVHENAPYIMPPQCVGAKLFNVYGPNEYHKGEQSSVVYQLFKQINEQGAVKLFKSIDPKYGDGEQKRDFIYVKDCVDTLLWFYDNPKISGLYNLGTGKARSFTELATTIFTVLGKEKNIQFVDMPDFLKDKYQNFTQAEMGKLVGAGYTKPFTPLEEGVKDYIQSYLLKNDPYL